MQNRRTQRHLRARFGAAELTGLEQPLASADPDGALFAPYRHPILYVEILQRLERVLLHPPPINRFDIEAPVAADLERRQTATLQLAIDRRRMHLQVVREFFDGKDMARVVVVHVIYLALS